MGRTYKRRNFFIKRELQGRYIFSFFLFAVLGTLLYAAIFSMLSADSMTMVYKDNVLTLGRTPSILFADMLKANWLLIIFGGFIGVVIAMFLTHRFAGPMYRIEVSVDRMSGGDLSFDVCLRKDDEGKELAEAVNRFKDRVATDVAELRKMAGEVEGHLNRAMSGDEQAAAALADAKTINGEIRSRLEAYKTGE